MKLESKIEKYSKSYIDFILKNRFSLICVSIFLAVLIATGAQNLQFAADARVFLGKNNPERLTLDELEDTYTRSNTVTFVLTPRSGEIFTPENLVDLATMTEEAWQLPYTLRVESISNHNTTRATGDDIVVKPLYNPAEIVSRSDAEKVRKTALSEPEIINYLVSPKGDVAAIFGIVVLPENDGAAIPTVSTAARELMTRWQSKYKNFEVRLTGGVLADLTFAEAGSRDFLTYVPVISAILIIGLSVFLGSFRATAFVVIVFAATVSATLGLAGWMSIVMNAATGTSPIAIMVIVVASSVHLILTWTHNWSSSGGGDEAIRTSLETNLAPISVTNVTTALGFLCLNFSDSPPLRDFGNIVATGTLIGWVLTLSLLPALLSYITVKPARKGVWVEKMMHAIAAFTVRRRIALIAAFAVFLPAVGFGLTNIEFDDDYVRYFDERYEFRRHTEYAEQNLIGLHFVQFSLKSGENGGIFEPAFLRKIDRFTQWLNDQPHVSYVGSPSKLFKRLNRVANGGEDKHYSIADTRPKNAQNLLLYELGLPVGHDLNSMIDVDRSSVLVNAAVRGASSKDIRSLAIVAEAWLKQNMPEISGPATGLTVVFAYISHRNIKGMIVGTLLALTLISIIMFPAFRSARFGLISLIPNILPAFIAFGIWGYLIGNVNLASSIVCGMTLGIIVDDTVHIMMKYLRARREEGSSAEQAIHQLMPTVGLALVITTITLGCGFGIIAMSGFQISQHLGGLTVIVLVAALIADFLLLLPLLVTFDKWLMKKKT